MYLAIWSFVANKQDTHVIKLIAAIFGYWIGKWPYSEKHVVQQQTGTKFVENKAAGGFCPWPVEYRE